MEIHYKVQIPKGNELEQVCQGTRKVERPGAWQSTLNGLVDELYQKYGTWATVELSLTCEDKPGD